MCGWSIKQHLGLAQTVQKHRPTHDYVRPDELGIRWSGVREGTRRPEATRLWQVWYKWTKDWTVLAYDMLAGERGILYLGLLGLQLLSTSCILELAQTGGQPPLAIYTIVNMHAGWSRFCDPCQSILVLGAKQQAWQDDSNSVWQASVLTGFGRSTDNLVCLTWLAVGVPILQLPLTFSFGMVPL